MTLIERLQARAHDPKLATDMWQDVVAHPVVTIEAVEAAERELGFRLPRLLREIYTQVGDGGFGPGWSMVSMQGGTKTDAGLNLVADYHAMRQPDPDIPTWRWPEGLVRICNWGCGIYSCIDCLHEETPVVRFHSDLLLEEELAETALQPEAESLTQWLTDWVDGVDLWERFYEDEEKEEMLLHYGGHVLDPAMLSYGEDGEREE